MMPLPRVLHDNNDELFSASKHSKTTSEHTTPSSQPKGRRRRRMRRRGVLSLSFSSIAFLLFLISSLCGGSLRFKCSFVEAQDSGNAGSTGTGAGAGNRRNQSNDIDNDWREWNYYQILGLAPEDYYYSQEEKNSSSSTSSSSTSLPIYKLSSRWTRRKERSTITKKEIKKAYRKQAQMWHPDKIMNARKREHNDGDGDGDGDAYNKKSKNDNDHNGDRSRPHSRADANKNGNGYSTNASTSGKKHHTKNITIEECNARFAKIAEAYEVLIDDEKRLEYDIYLLDHEDETKVKMDRQRQYQRQRQRYQEQGHQEERDQQSPTSMFFEGFKNNLDNFNPMNVFDDFFFGDTKMDDEYSGGTKFTMNDLFESFFGEDLYNTNAQSHSSSSTYSSTHDNHNQQQQFPYQQRQPDRVSEATQIRYDSKIQQEIIRVLHREEYDDHGYGYGNEYGDSVRVYYRVIGQEFVEDFDYYNGISLGYIPISDVYFVEDGYTTTTSTTHTSSFHQQQRQQQQRQQQRQQQQQRDYDYQEYHSNDFDHQSAFSSTFSNQDHRHQQRHQQEPKQRQLKNQASSTMSSNEYITPSQNKIFLKSKNGQYYSGLTPECELVIMQVNANKNYGLYDVDDDFVIWSSGTYLPRQYQGRGCAFAIYNGRIAVVAGNNIDRPMTILWNSPLPSIVPGSIVDEDDLRNSNEDIIDYYVSLDDDGSLAVYRTRVQGDENDNYDNDDDLVRMTSRWWNDLVSGESAIPSKTKAAAVWRSLRKWTNAKLLSKPKSEDEYESFSGSSKHYYKQRSNRSQHHRGQKRKAQRDECVFATGPAGCLIPGRYFVRISKDIKRTFDGAVENFVDVIREGSEDDIDAFDTATRVVTKTGQYFRSVTLRAYKEYAHDIQLFTSKARKVLAVTLRRMKSIWHECEIAMNLLHRQVERLKDFLFEVQ